MLGTLFYRCIFPSMVLRPTGSDYYNVTFNVLHSRVLFSTKRPSRLIFSFYIDEAKLEFSSRGFAP